MSYVEQTAQEGFGHAVYSAREWVGGEPFLLMLGDHIYASSTPQRCATQLLDAHAELGGTVLAVERLGEDQLPLCGTVRGEALTTPAGAYRVTEFAEKPAVDYARRNLRTPGLGDAEYLCVFGQYAIDPAVFDVLRHMIERDIREAGEIQFTGALEALRIQGVGSFALETKGRRRDTGVPMEYARTIHALAFSN
jgi:UTP--glucose-1-phosphate uridylyltransferase